MDMGGWSYTVDALGEVTGYTDAKSQSFSSAYDALSRPTQRYDRRYGTLSFVTFPASYPSTYRVTVRYQCSRSIFHTLPRRGIA